LPYERPNGFAVLLEQSVELASRHAMATRDCVGREIRICEVLFDVRADPRKSAATCARRGLLGQRQCEHIDGVLGHDPARNRKVVRRFCELCNVDGGGGRQRRPTDAAGCPSIHVGNPGLELLAIEMKNDLAEGTIEMKAIRAPVIT
jgi:hypothetical protein